MTADDDLLAMLGAVPNLNVWDSEVKADETKKVISVALPYLLFYSSPGRDRDERSGGQVGGRVQDFQLTGVGASREQAKAVLDRGRAALSRKFLNGNIIIRSDDDLPVRREDVYTSPGGAPLFYGVDRYSVAV